MRKILLIILFLGVYSFANSQNSTAVINAAGLQAGFLGGWLYNEASIANDKTLRVELGINMWFYESFGNQPYFYPSLSVEPRWYYNILKREKKNKSINKNSADFISIKGGFVPEFAHVPIKSGYSFSNSFAIVAGWGLRREIAKNVFAELGIGVGYEFYFGKNAHENNLLILPHFRIGM